MKRRSLLKGSLALAGLPLASRLAMGADSNPLTLWYNRGGRPEQQKILDEVLLGPFNATHPESPVTLEFKTGSTNYQQIKVGLLSGTGPDIVTTSGPSYAASLADADLLLPLDDYISQYGLDKRIVGPVLKSGYFKGKIYSIPRTVETMVLYLNKTLFAEKGWAAPKSLAELTTVAEAMLSAGITPFALGNASWRGTNEWVVTVVLNHMAGPDAVYQALSGQLPWTDKVFEDSIELLNRWYQDGWFGSNYFSLTGDQYSAAFGRGEAGMCPGGTFLYDLAANAFKESGQEFEIIPFPTLRDGVSYPIYTIGVGSCWSIAKASKNPDGAAAFLDYAYSKEYYQNIMKDWPGDWNIPLTDVDTSMLAQTVSPVFASAVGGMSAAMQEGKYGYTTWVFWPPATNEYLIRGIEDVWLGNATVKDYLGQMQSIFEGEFKEGKVLPLAPRA